MIKEIQDAEASFRIKNPVEPTKLKIHPYDYAVLMDELDGFGKVKSFLKSVLLESFLGLEVEIDIYQEKGKVMVY